MALLYRIYVGCQSNFYRKKAFDPLVLPCYTAVDIFSEESQTLEISSFSGMGELEPFAPYLTLHDQARRPVRL
jgi:hypothetical protein